MFCACTGRARANEASRASASVFAASEARRVILAFMVPAFQTCLGRLAGRAAGANQAARKRSETKCSRVPYSIAARAGCQSVFCIAFGPGAGAGRGRYAFHKHSSSTPQALLKHSSSTPQALRKHKRGSQVAARKRTGRAADGVQTGRAWGIIARKSSYQAS